jgi:hypothetical protein
MYFNLNYLNLNDLFHLHSNLIQDFNQIIINSTYLVNFIIIIIRCFRKISYMNSNFIMDFINFYLHSNQLN